jgi:hypothetical protein
MPEIDWTQVLIAIIVLVLPSVLRELRAFYNNWAVDQPDIAYKLSQAAEFGVKAAQVMKDNGVWTENKGTQAEAHAVNVAQNYLDRLGIKISIFFKFIRPPILPALILEVLAGLRHVLAAGIRASSTSKLQVCQTIRSAALTRRDDRTW